MVEFIKKHKVPLIIMAAVVILYLVYDYITAQNAANQPSAAGTTDAADQAALQDELANLASGATGGSISSPIASSPAITGVIPSGNVSTGSAASNPSSSTGTSAVSGAGTSTMVPAGVQSVMPTAGAFAPSGPAQLQESQAVMYSSGTQSTDEAATLIQQLQAGDPTAIAAEQLYNNTFSEQDPTQAQAAYAAGSNPYLLMLNQQATGGGGQTPGEAEIGKPIPAGNAFQFPTELEVSSDPTGSGGSGSSAGTSGGTSSSVPATLGIVPGGSLIPRGATVASVTRPLTTVTSSNQPKPVAVNPQPVIALTSVLQSPTSGNGLGGTASPVGPPTVPIGKRPTIGSIRTA